MSKFWPLIFQLQISYEVGHSTWYFVLLHCIIIMGIHPANKTYELNSWVCHAFRFIVNYNTSNEYVAG